MEDRKWVLQAQELFGAYHMRLILSLVSKCSKRTVHRWVSGETRIKQDVVDKIDKTYEIWRDK